MKDLKLARAQLMRFEAAKLEPWIALRNSIGVAISLGISFYFGAPDVGLILALGSLVVSYSDGSDSYASRGSRMLAASFFSALAVFVASLSAKIPLLAMALTVGGAFAAGYSIVLGVTLSDIALIGLIMFIIFAVQPVSLETATSFGIYTFLGGVFQIVLSLFFWPLHRYNPERRALSRLFAELSNLCKAHVRTVEMPLGSSQSIRAQDVLRALARNSSNEALRYRSILSQAERIRLTLIYIARLRRRYQRESIEGGELLSDIFAVAGEILEMASTRLKQDRKLETKLYERAVIKLKELRQAVQKMRDQNPSIVKSLTDAIRLSDALSGQLRAIVDLISKTSERGEAKERAIEKRKPLRLRAGSALATLRANLTLSSSGFRHGLRLAVCVGLGLLAGHFVAGAFSVRRIYWIPMTVAIVLRPDYGGTIGRSLLRLSGTLIGLVLATVLFHYTALNNGVEIILIALFMFMLRWVGAAHYGIFALATTGLVVLLFAYTGVNPQDVIWLRGINTVLGSCIALVAYRVWPTWEKNHASAVLGKLIESYRRYFAGVCDLYLNTAAPFSPAVYRQLDLLRQDSRVERTNLQTSLDRVRAEPGVTNRQLELLSGIWASSNRFAHSMMALESNAEPLAGPSAAAFKDFASEADAYIQQLLVAIDHQAALDSRGNLRALHTRLIETSAPTLLGVETDRLTNSLNTLSEQVSTWMLLNLSRRSGPIQEG